MKKSLAVILSAAVFSLVFCSCDGHIPSAFDDDETTATTAETTLPDYTVARSPHHDLNRVDETMDFGTINLSFKEAWGAHQDLRMAHGTIHNYFSYYSLDAYDNRVNENLNTVSTISRPTVLEYPADKDGYVIYEVTYTQTFPISSKEPNSIHTAFWSYHGVGFLDYYTGQTFPTINLSTQIDSFSVTGEVVWNGKTYDMGYYEFRENEWISSTSEQVDSNYMIRKELVNIISTSYFLVPEGYDGIVMFVYVADDTNMPLEEVLAENNPYYTETGYFGDDENPNDYVFIGINAPS